MKKEYALIDVLKLLMAMLVMLAHICSEKVDVNPAFKLVTSLYNFGVPFFIVCSSYFLFSKMEKQSSGEARLSYIKFSKHIGLVYLIWSLIYFSFVLRGWFVNGADSKEIFDYLHKALVFTTYGTIWFLPALWGGISILYFLYSKYKNLNVIYLSAIVIYIIGSLGYSYRNILPEGFILDIYNGYDSVMCTTRNFIFFAYPLAVIGLYIALNGDKIGGQIKNFAFMSLFGILFVIEAVVIKHFSFGANVDMGIMLLPAMYFMVTWALNVNMKSSSTFIFIRNMSALIFLTQRLFITAIPSLLSSETLLSIEKIHSYLGILLYVCPTLLLSYILIILSRKYPKIKILW